MNGESNSNLEGSSSIDPPHERPLNSSPLLTEAPPSQCTSQAAGLVRLPIQECKLQAPRMFSTSYMESDGMYNPTRNPHFSSNGSLTDHQKYLELIRTNSSPGSCMSTYPLSTDNLLESLRLCGENKGLQLPPKVPPFSPPTGHSSSHFDSNSMISCSFPISGHDSDHHGSIKPDLATAVPAAHNPVFWILQGSDRSSQAHGQASMSSGLQEMLQHSQQFFKSSRDQNGASTPEQFPEIEMRLGPFTSYSRIASLRSNYAGSVDKGDLNSMTACFQLPHFGASSVSNHIICPRAPENSVNARGAYHSSLRSYPFKGTQVEVEKALTSGEVAAGGRHEQYHWDQGISASSSTSNNTEISMFETSTLFWGGGLVEKSDAAKQDQLMLPRSVKIDQSSVAPATQACSDHSGGFSPDQSDGDTVMKWCSDQLMPTPEQPVFSAATCGHHTLYQENHQSQTRQGKVDQSSPDQSLVQDDQSFSNSRVSMHWQNMHQGGQDMYDPSVGDRIIAPMSPELQRMAAVLDQI